MALSPPETNPENGTPPPLVPNFREDERNRARYESMLQRRIKTHFVEHESSIRRNASNKRDELREELNEAQAEWEALKATADAAREAYRKAYPHHVKKMHLDEPSVLENLRSRGAASKLYQTAKDAWHAAETATSNIRRLEHNENQLDIELKKAIERAPVVSKEVTESEEWLAEIHAEEELANVKAKVDEIDAERESYARRLSAGTVPPDELRLRTFAETDIKHIALPIDGIIFYRIDTFGPKAYFIVRDLRKQLYALPYDRRLEPILGGVYDITRSGKEFEVRRHARQNTRIPLTVLEHFQKCSDNPEAAQDAYRQHQEFLSEKRAFATLEEYDDIEVAAMAAFLAFVAKEAP
jgi:predicted GNAT family acetyltransferase